MLCSWWQVSNGGLCSYECIDCESSRRKKSDSLHPTNKGEVTLYANKTVGLIEKSAITSGLELLEKWKVLTSRGYGEGGEAREYPRMMMGKPIIAPPASACTETYIVVGSYEAETEASFDNMPV